MGKLIILFLGISFAAFSQQADWIKKPKEQWPQIAMINEVWYKNGERYIDPSFKYAATGFLIDTGTDTLAATVKHVLWIAKTKSMNSVDLKDNLQGWIMHPNGSDCRGICRSTAHFYRTPANEWPSWWSTTRTNT